MSGILSGIPEGKFRVVQVNLQTAEDKLIGDYSPASAKRRANQHNRRRRRLFDPVLWVYNEFGQLVHDQQAVGEPNYGSYE